MKAGTLRMDSRLDTVDQVRPGHCASLSLPAARHEKRTNERSTTISFLDPVHTFMHTLHSMAPLARLGSPSFWQLCTHAVEPNPSSRTLDGCGLPNRVQLHKLVPRLLK